MQTSCLRCRVIRQRITSVMLLAAGKDVYKIQSYLEKSNPDITYTVDVVERRLTLTASKDGWHFEILRERSK